MNENQNDDRSAAFQAGEPLRAEGALREGAPLDAAAALTADDADAGATQSRLDAVAATIKGYERWGLAAGIALQLGVLLAMMLMGGVKEIGGRF